jgi:hypothetical protein
MKWEWFDDSSYYNLGCVRPAGERRFGCGFHLHSHEEARVLAEFLSEIDAPNPWAETVSATAPT